MACPWARYPSSSSSPAPSVWRMQGYSLDLQTLMTPAKDSRFTLKSGIWSGSPHLKISASHGLFWVSEYVLQIFLLSSIQISNHSLVFDFHLFLVVFVPYLVMDVRVFPYCQHLEHENAKGPNITPEHKYVFFCVKIIVHIAGIMCVSYHILEKRVFVTKLYDCLHAGELLLEKCLRGSPLDRQLFPLLLSPFRRLHCKTKVCNLRPEKLVQQDVPEESRDLQKRNLDNKHLAARSLCTILRLSRRSIPRATSMFQESSLLQIFVSAFILCGSFFSFCR